ncbi:MAG: PHP domain-containing protein [Dethiobacter sp.]|jgi:PHP family Zn ribbon phosphoesterase|nr:PHP domain-containing protein [Dethiobacter sp.]
MQNFWADLHIHTALSPCAGEDMTPLGIIQKAEDLGIKLIAVTDHNSAENVPSLVKASTGSKVRVLPGMEVQTREEVHLICLFENVDLVLAWQEKVYAHLPQAHNNERLFGSQWLLDSGDRRVGRLDRLLLTSTSLSVEEVVEGVNNIGGLCIPAHIDRPSFSLISNLGFIPQNLQVAALELSPKCHPVTFRKLHPDVGRLKVVISSDAHWLEAMRPPQTCFRLQEMTWQEIQLALAGDEGREVVVIDDKGLSNSTLFTE